MRYSRLLALALLAGCGSLNPVTLVQLAMLNPLTVDPEHMAVAVTVPDSIGIQTDSVVLTIYGRPSPDAEEVRSQFILDQVKDGQTNLFRVARSDVPALRLAQARHARWEAADADAESGGFSVAAAPCFRADPIPFDQIEGTMSLSIQVTETGRQLPLFHDVPLTDIAAKMTQENDEIETLPQCNTGD